VKSYARFSDEAFVNSVAIDEKGRGVRRDLEGHAASGAGRASTDEAEAVSMIQQVLRLFLCFIIIGTIEPESLNAALVQTSSRAVREGKVSRDSVDLYFRIIGDKGPLVIILAGGPGADPGYMQPVFTELSKNYQCVLFEQRGTGRSKLKTYDFPTINFQEYLEDLEALRTELKQQKLLLVGNSWGAMLALSYAGTYPNRASELY
jgi:predicted alpha/beta-fold hydrolase